jgi:hypothetical protein
MGFCAGGVARHDAVAKVLTTRLPSLLGVTVVQSVRAEFGSGRAVRAHGERPRTRSQQTSSPFALRA